MFRKRFVKLAAFPLIAAMVLTMTAYFDSTANIAYATTMATYYVDPVNGSDTNNGTSTGTAFKTIEKAQRTVRTINGNMTGDICVYLRGGTYTLNGTLEFSEADSGTNGYKVIYRNYSTETPVVSGGKAVTGWTDIGGGVYRASVGAADNFRQLYVNGARATRAKSAGGIPGTVTKESYGYRTTDTGIRSWANQGNIEFVYQDTEFTQKRLLVNSIVADGAYTRINMKDPYWTTADFASIENPNEFPIFIENAYELLDTAGEWYLNNSTHYVYYKPLPGENMGTATVVAPMLEKLVEVRGMLNNRAQNIRFEGITFCYATYLRPSTAGHLGLQANMNLPDEIPADHTNWTAFLNKPDPGNVTVEAAKNVSFINCAFSHLGSAGIELVYTQGCTVSLSTFSDISGNGINVLGYVHEPVLDNPDKLSLDNCIDNNTIHDVACEYKDGVGIFVGYAQNTTVARNEIYDVPYTGITVGWGWGASNYTDDYITRDNKIIGNKVHDCMQEMADGAPLYTLGAQPGSYVFANYFSGNGSALGIYHDQGSMNFADFCNVCENVEYYAGTNFNLPNEAQDATNNYVFNNYSDTPYFAHNGSVPSGINFEGVVTGYTLPGRDAAAQSIMDASGPTGSSYAPTPSPAGWKVYDDDTTGYSRSPYVLPDFNKFTYTGAWGYEFLSGGVMNGTIRYSNTANDYATFKFHGTQVQYYSPKSSNYGTAYLSIDSGAETSVNLYSGGWVDSACVHTISGLSDGDHTLRIRVGAGGGYVPVDAVAIYCAPDTYSSTKYYNDDAIGCPGNNNQFFYSRDAGGNKQWYDENCFSRGTIHYSDIANAYATFRFTGPYVGWYSPKSTNYGTGYVSIDNGSETEVNLYSGGWVDSACVWTNPTALSNGVHTIKVRVAGNGYVPVDGFEVTWPGYMSPTTVNDSATGSGENQFNYSGTWINENNGSCSGGTIRYSNTTNNYVTLKFKGTQIKWFATRSSNYGIGAVSILSADGSKVIVPETMIDAYTYTGSIVYNQLLWSSPILSNGEYMLKIRVTGTKNPGSSDTWVLVDGVQVIK